jgi:methionine aminotransferase
VSQQPDVEFARALTREIGVAAIPVSVFSAGDPPERLVRFCFAKNDATLDAAGERLSRLVAPGGCR